MKQPCGTTVEDIHRITTDAIESSNSEGLGAVKFEAVESVTPSNILVGKVSGLSYGIF